jgi:hypothetical protein
MNQPSYARPRLSSTVIIHLCVCIYIYIYIDRLLLVLFSIIIYLSLFFCHLLYLVLSAVHYEVFFIYCFVIVLIGEQVLGFSCMLPHCCK